MVELKNNIITLCNNSGLNIEAVLFVLKDLYRDAQDAYEMYEEKKKENENNEEKEVNE